MGKLTTLKEANSEICQIAANLLNNRMSQYEEDYPIKRVPRAIMNEILEDRERQRLLVSRLTDVYSFIARFNQGCGR